MKKQTVTIQRGDVDFEPKLAVLVTVVRKIGVEADGGRDARPRRPHGSGVMWRWRGGGP
ncbi:hypothetical protein J7E96_20015 [Streptomyces sp. ISL-96]|uniref:hypothetical protein n=1 Tax=Streptomyces sp. ISL-96 TaxID=2819191 RepID=UPI001BEB00EE|nr:hypothetical protein [Streptomyces sp. ISL-96]MBT2490759.1 hypothetical protein [Streptomyces sp. ISL-96]